MVQNRKDENAKVDETDSAKKATSEAPKKNNTCCICGVIAAVLCVIGAIIAVFVLRFVGPFWSGSSDDANRAIESAAESQNAKPEVTDRELLDYFTSITFTASVKNNQPCAAERWPDETVTVSISGIPNTFAVQSVDNVITKFNEISTTTKLAKVDSGGKMEIIFETQEEMKADGNKDPDAAIFGWARPNPNSNCAIQSAEIHIGTDSFKSEMGENAVIVHEISHALGFMGHDRAKIGCNSLTDVVCAPMETYNQYDTSAIKMLYNSGLSFCATKAEAEEMFANNVPR